MGRNAERVQEYLLAVLAERIPDAEWETEYRVGGTPVDVGGVTEAGELCVVELEWRRADPADNAAKIFRHATETVDGGRVGCFSFLHGTTNSQTAAFLPNAKTPSSSARRRREASVV